MTSGSIAENDIVLLRSKRASERTSKILLTKPLTPGGITETHSGRLVHDKIIGSRLRDDAITTSGYPFTIHRPTLAEYVELTPRIVTPIYPADANLIVSLLDIHVSPPTPSSEDDPPLEILEAGTGHGALTLYLARVVHAANSARPPLPLLRRHAKEVTQGAEDHEHALEEQRRAYEEWKLSRKAIIHTLDTMPRHSQHAESIVREFHHGIYAGNVDFHTGDPSEWVSKQLEIRSQSLDITAPPSSKAEPFLSHVLLDLPNVYKHIERMQDALVVDGLLVIFTPSITQIAQCVQLIHDKKLGFAMQEVLELGLANSGLGSGRQWDVRVTKGRENEQGFGKIGLKPRDHNVTQGEEGAGSDGNQGEETTLEATTVLDKAHNYSEAVASTDSGTGGGVSEGLDSMLRMVCRPKVGGKIARIAGGGFVAVWRRMRKKGFQETATRST